MNATNRVLNRAVLLAAGILLFVIGASAMLAGIRPTGAEPMIAGATRGVADAASRARAWRMALPGGGTVSGAEVVVVAALVVVVALLAVFLATRGRGKTRTVLRQVTGQGRTSVDRGIAATILTEQLSARADVLSATVEVYRVRRAPAIALTVRPRRGADLARLLAAVEDVVHDWDRLAGVRVPVAVHLADRRRVDGLRSAARVR
ncbi:hypothetical protein ET475_11100 [Microbacterium protaetiae]|uniref:Uncharacterized protein n=1 Tax=Microbacterium protaetiae TaxID=2509458 RepID=A0A4P6ERE5_9MICO|nr:hypothetical protein [Microbacterium protaetiae]QAY60478.1 hypothetical protein ET475_11100 [Microbacterium protaetiae]